MKLFKLTPEGALTSFTICEFPVALVLNFLLLIRNVH